MAQSEPTMNYQSLLAPYSGNPASLARILTSVIIHEKFYIPSRILVIPMRLRYMICTPVLWSCNSSNNGSGGGFTTKGQSSSSARSSGGKAGSSLPKKTDLASILRFQGHKGGVR